MAHHLRSGVARARRTGPIVGPDGDWTGGAIDRTDPDRHDVVSALLAAAFLDHEVLDIEYDDWMDEVGAVLSTLSHMETDHSVILAEQA